MRSLQFDLPDANLSELKRITGLIRQCASPDMIVLYGRYAGGTLASALGGYELLLLTAKNPPAATEGVMRFLCEYFPCEQRAERYLAVQSHAIGLVTDLLPRSYFFYKVYQEGVMLYDNGVCRFPRQVRFKPALVFKRAVSDAEKYAENASSTASNIQSDVFKFVQLQFYINIDFQPEAGQLLINYHYYFIKIKTASQPKFSLVSSVFHRYGPNFPQK